MVQESHHAVRLVPATVGALDILILLECSVDVLTPRFRQPLVLAATAQDHGQDEASSRGVGGRCLGNASSSFAWFEFTHQMRGL